MRYFELEVSDLGRLTVDALEDNKISRDEIRAIRAKWESVRARLEKLNIKFLAAKAKNGGQK